MQPAPCPSPCILLCHSDAAWAKPALWQEHIAHSLPPCWHRRLMRPPPRGVLMPASMERAGRARMEWIGITYIRMVQDEARLNSRLAWLNTERGWAHRVCLGHALRGSGGGGTRCGRPALFRHVVPSRLRPAGGSGAHHCAWPRAATYSSTSALMAVSLPSVVTRRPPAVRSVTSARASKAVTCALGLHTTSSSSTSPAAVSPVGGWDGAGG